MEFSRSDARTCNSRVTISEIVSLRNRKSESVNSSLKYAKGIFGWLPRFGSALYDLKYFEYFLNFFIQLVSLGCNPRDLIHLWQ